MGKEGEVRARVSTTTVEALETLAIARGEKLPVIVREALAEYLARRVESNSKLQELFQSEPGVLEAMHNLARSLQPQQPQPPPRPVTYRTPKKPRAEKPHRKRLGNGFTS